MKADDALPSTPQTLAVESLIGLREICDEYQRGGFLAPQSRIRLALLDAQNAERHYRATMDPTDPDHWQYVK